MRFLTTPVLVLISGGLAAQSVSLGDLPGIARDRADRQRPEQEQALQPFWEDLSLDYRLNSEYLDARIQEVAELGDRAVPILLEKLAPKGTTAVELHLAANCERVLALLEPASFIDALVDLATGGSTEARRHAITLLGLTGSSRAVPVLATLLPELQSDADTVRALQALTLLGDGRVADRAVALLDSGAEVRQAVLAYLNATEADEAGAEAVVKQVNRALAAETEAWLIRGYIDYLGGVVRGDSDIATRLLALLKEGQLGGDDQIAICKALATVAPQKHGPTTETLREILDAGQTGDLGRAAAVTLYRLGDSEGADKLIKKLELEARRNRNEASAHSEVAELYFDLGLWMQAIAEYRQAARLGRRETRTWCHLRIARCEARLRRWKNVLSALRDSNARRSSILVEAEQDPILQAALQEEIVARWLESLPW